MQDLQSFTLSLSVKKSFSYLEYRSDRTIQASDEKVVRTPYSLIQWVEIDNDTETEYEDLLLRFRFDNPIFSPFEVHTGPIAKREEEKKEGDGKDKRLSLRLPLYVDSERLYSLTAVDYATLSVECVDPASEATLAQAEKRFRVLPKEQATDSFLDAPLLLSEYCVTGLVSELQVLRDASELMRKELGEEKQSFLGYQNEGEEGILSEASYLFRAVHDKQGLIYNNPPPGGEGFQNVRLPNQVLEKEKQATCLDFAILYASLLLMIGLHPILLIIHGHALAGFFLKESACFPEGALMTTRANYLLSAGLRGSRELALVECTALRQDSPIGFHQALSLGNEALEGYRGYLAAIDVARAQEGCFKPLPLPQEDGKIDFSIRPVKLEQGESSDLEAYHFQPIEEKEEKDRFATWERKLLDLTAKNRLVSDTHAREGRVWIPFLDGDGLLRFLKKWAERGVKLLPVLPTFTSQKGDLPESEAAALSKRQAEGMACGRLSALLFKEKQLDRLIRASKSAMEETGSPTLYLAIGMVSALDERGSKAEPIEAPLLLLPISLTLKKAERAYQLDYDLDSLSLNETFFEYIRLKKGVDFQRLYGAGGSADFRSLVQEIRSSGEEVKVDESLCYLSNYTFGHYVMWNDIKRRKEELKKNPIVLSLLENRSLVQNKDVLQDKGMDELDGLSSFAAPLPYDSTQLRAILEAGEGNSFVLDGPPGTGKSQTIANMIVNALYHGKSVLFVAEKMAALEVVERRLSDLKLDRFALQLYSNKADKKSFLKQLGDSIEAGHLVGVGLPPFEKTCQQARERRDELKKEVAALHSHWSPDGKESRFYSLFEAIVQSRKSKPYAGKFSLSPDFAASYHGVEDEEIRRIFAQLPARLEAVPSFPKGPGRYLHFESFSYQEQESLHPAFLSLSLKEERLHSRLSSFLEKVGGKEPRSKEELSSFLAFLNEVSSSPADFSKANDLSCLSHWQESLPLFEKAGRYAELKKSLGRRLKEESLSSLPGETLKEELSSARGIFAKFKARRRFKKATAPALLPGSKLAKKEALPLLEELSEYQSLFEELSEKKGPLDSFFGEDILPHAAEISSEKEKYAASGKLYERALSYHGPAEGISFLPYRARSPFERMAFENEVALLQADFSSFLEEYEPLEKEYGIDPSLYEGGFLPFVGELCQEVLSTPPEEFNGLASLGRSRAILSHYGLAKLYDGLWKGEYAVEDIGGVYEAALARAFLLLELGERGEFSSFDPEEYDAKLEEYGRLIDEYSTSVAAETMERVSRRFASPATDFEAGAPIGTLRKIIGSNGRGKTIRQILNDPTYGPIVRSYFPCFMMSPLSAAQYLDVGSAPFDLVIFDEASQVQTCEAVGPIARGKALIVAGDPKQMPPTNYFQASTNLLSSEQGEGEDYEVEDSESFLDDCLGIGMPRIPLLFHYRSRHESLIAFSNENFYGGSLFTFPSVDARKSHVVYQEVPCSPEKGNLLPKEMVDALLDAVRWSLGAFPGKSFGIIVFNLPQQEQVYEALSDYLAKNPDLRKKAEASASEPYFVKNLENVQGDERDVILFSVCFGKDRAGKAIVNGPLTLPGGERRLNVAASRAKEEMLILTSIAPEAIKKGKNDGPSALRAFLSLARSLANPSGMGEGGVPRYAPASDIARSLQADIEAMGCGYEADLSVGNSEFKLSLAVRKQGEEDYFAGILLDDCPPGKNVSSRDRFYVEPAVLEGLHWRILRVYSYVYFRSRDTLLRRLKEALGEAEKGGEAPKGHPFQAPSFAMANEKFDYHISPYRPYVLRGGDFIPDYRITSPWQSYDERVVGLLYRILQSDSPCSYSRLKEYMRESFQVKKIGSQAESSIQSALSLLQSRRQISFTEDFEGERFYWRIGQSVSSFEKGGLADPLLTSKEEILFLMNEALEEQRQLGREDLLRATSKLLGLSVLGPKAREKLEYVIDYAKRNGLLREGYFD